jgi:2-hydroxychromene-2-carboxylate isomerase
MQKIHLQAERARIRAGQPHRLEYFHQVDDAYSYLAAQALRPLLAHYDVELVPHLVFGPSGANLPEPDLLPALARHDAALVAPHYGLEYPAGAPAPAAEHSLLAQQVLAGVAPGEFPEAAVAVGRALLAADETALDALGKQYGMASVAETETVLAAGTARRAGLKHYSGAMFYYGGLWYWGVDRLYHLERRWRGLGLGQGGELLFPRPPIDPGSYRDNGSITLEVYASLRSPYTAVIFDKAVELAERTGVRLEVRPVLPMVMRGVAATREKGMYIFADAAREARALGLDYGNIYDPIGEPVRRCYSLYSWAESQGREVALVSAFLRAAFYQGVNTDRDSGMRHVVEQAGLSWPDAQKIIDNDDWKPRLEQNRQVMYGFGSWGVPTFRLLDARGNTVVWAWGQDRLWLIAREIQRLLVQA